MNDPAIEKPEDTATVEPKAKIGDLIAAVRSALDAGKVDEAKAALDTLEQAAAEEETPEGEAAEHGGDPADYAAAMEGQGKGTPEGGAAAGGEAEAGEGEDKELADYMAKRGTRPKVKPTMEDYFASRNPLAK